MKLRFQVDTSSKPNFISNWTESLSRNLLITSPAQTKSAADREAFCLLARSRRTLTFHFLNEDVFVAALTFRGNQGDKIMINEET